MTPAMSVIVKVFGCRPLTDGATYSGGRRTKTSKGRNRGTWDVVVQRALWGFKERACRVDGAAARRPVGLFGVQQPGGAPC
jgi:hypothetical protein